MKSLNLLLSNSAQITPNFIICLDNLSFFNWRQIYKNSVVNDHCTHPLYLWKRYLQRERAKVMICIKCEGWKNLKYQTGKESIIYRYQNRFIVKLWLLISLFLHKKNVCLTILKSLLQNFYLLFLFYLVMQSISCFGQHYFLYIVWKSWKKEEATEVKLILFHS